MIRLAIKLPISFSSVLGTNVKIYSNQNQEKTSGQFVTSDYIIEDGNRTYKIYVLGDVDGDGKLSLQDIMKTANYIYKDKTSLTGVYLKAADFDIDNNYSLQDIMKMANKLYKGGI